MTAKKRVPTSGEPFIWRSPFTALSGARLRGTSEVRQSTDQPVAAPKE